MKTTVLILRDKHVARYAGVTVVTRNKTHLAVAFDERRDDIIEWLPIVSKAVNCTVPKELTR